MIYVHEHAGTGETYFAETDAGTAIWKIVATFRGGRALERARTKYPKAVNHMPLGATGEEDLAEVKRLERAKRMEDYLVKWKGEIRAIVQNLEIGLTSGANVPAREALHDLASHYTDLENAIEGNG